MVHQHRIFLCLHDLFVKIQVTNESINLQSSDINLQIYAKVIMHNVYDVILSLILQIMRAN